VRPALFINDLRSGGAERLVTDLAVELTTLEDVDPVAVVAADLGGFREELETAGVEVHSLDVPVTTTGIPAGVTALVRLVRAESLEVVHSHLPYAHVVGRLACLRTGTSHVSTYHNVREHKTLPRRLAERATEPLSDRIVCVSEGVKRSYGGGERRVVIPNAIDVSDFERRVAEADTDTVESHGEDDTVLLNVARCVEQKRQRDLIDAMGTLREEPIHLYIVGDGPLRENLERAVEAADLEDSITVTGFVESVAPYFAVADAFVSASANEGLPTTHLEAMAARLGIVSTRIPGVTELVDDGTTGYLCAVGDTRALADAMRSIATPAATEFGDRGYERARSEYSLQRATQDHYELYAELIDTGGDGREVTPPAEHPPERAGTQ
jgi:glycosyltransferase involved in cell wall biosynthesis